MDGRPMLGADPRRLALALAIVSVLAAALVIPAPTAGASLMVAYSATPVADGDLDGNPATGAWGDAASATVPLENQGASPYGTVTFYAKHDGTYAYLRVDGKIDVAWASATGNHFWFGMIYGPAGVTGHHQSAQDGVFFGLWDGTNYAPQPTRPPIAVDTHGGSRPPAKDTTQNVLGKMDYSGSAAPYSFTAEWKRQLNTGDTQDVVLTPDGTSQYPFAMTTDSDGGGSSGGNLDHSKTTNSNVMQFATVPSGDPTPPTATLTAPSEGASLTGLTTITATASDNVGVTKVEFYVDTTLLGTATSPPYSQAWDTNTATEGGHAVRAKAYDAAANSATALANVTVDRTAPVANAGPGIRASPGGVVILDGRGSTDNIAVVNWTWTFTDGGAVTLYLVRPSYQFNNLGNFTIALTVRDAVGLTASASTWVDVVSDAAPPVARAGPSQQVVQGTLVSLDGSASTDDVGIANWTWAWTDTTPVTVWGALVRHRFLHVGDFVVTLTVKDFSGKTGTTSTAVNVSADNTPPTAVAGPDQTISLGQNVTLDASASTDNGYIVNYTWRIGGTSRELWGAVVVDTPADAGTVTYTLNVTDAGGLRATDALIVTVIGPDVTPPAVPLGLMARTSENGSVVLSWNASADSDLAGYLVFRADSPEGPFLRLNAEAWTGTTYRDTGLVPERLYYYEIRSVDRTNNTSAPSVVAQAAAGARPAAAFDWISLRWVAVPVGAAAVLTLLALLLRREERRRPIPPPPPSEVPLPPEEESR